MKNEYIPKSGTAEADTLLLFSLSVIRFFANRGVKTDRTKDSIHACEEMTNNIIVAKELESRNIGYQHTKAELLRTKYDEQEAIRNAASYYLYRESDAEKILVMSYCMDVVAAYLGVQSKKVAWF